MPVPASSAHRCNAARHASKRIRVQQIPPKLLALVAPSAPTTAMPPAGHGCIAVRVEIEESHDTGFFQVIADQHEAQREHPDRDDAGHAP